MYVIINTKAWLKTVTTKSVVTVRNPKPASNADTISVRPAEPALRTTRDLTFDVAAAAAVATAVGGTSNVRAIAQAIVSTSVPRT